MFDLRYHVASLAAVFLALIIGILVGVGISGKGFVSDSERSLFNARIADLKSQLDSQTKRSTDLARTQRAAQSFVEGAYPALMDSRLAGQKVGVIFAGPVDGSVRSLVDKTLEDAGGGSPIRTTALKLPIDLPSLRRALRGRPALQQLATQRRIGELGRRLGTDLVLGGDSQAWQALSAQLVEEQSGDETVPVDAVVVNRSTKPQSGVTARFLAGFYSGLAAPDVPAVGVEVTRPGATAVPAFAKQKLSTVDDLDSEAGRLALALLLSGADGGQYGVKKTAQDGVLPPIPVG